MAATVKQALCGLSPQYNLFNLRVRNDAAYVPDDYQSAVAMRDALQSELDNASAALKVFPRGAMGLTPDEVKASPAWKDAKRAVDVAFQRLRDFNGVYTKKFSAEIRKNRR